MYKFSNYYLKNLELRREKKSPCVVNDRLYLNSLILVGKVTGEEVLFPHVPVFVLDGTLQERLQTSLDIIRPL